MYYYDNKRDDEPIMPTGKSDENLRPGVPRERRDAPEIYHNRPAPRPVYVARWSEPTYSAPGVEDMYSPGINPNGAYASARARADKPKRQRADGRFWARAACLLLACAIISVTASVLVTEIRLRDMEQGPITQVVLGTDSGAHRPSPNPVAAIGGGMLAQDIYDMATLHVVAIRTAGASSPGGMVRSSVGSGFIISADGYILTNFHVVETGYNHGVPITVHLHDGSYYTAAIIGYDADSDVAVIKIDAAGLHPATIGNSDAIRVGQRVYAVGNPFGELVYTMTEGIISALDRVVTVDGRSINTFQLSAAVNSGNSGGPVYDTNGEVIGIVTVKFMGNAVEGIGFAIPINDAIEIASELIETGFISGRARIGITGRTVDRAVSEFFSWAEGAYVLEIAPGSAAVAAGLQIGDVITHLGGDRVHSINELIMVLRRFRADETTVITVRRAGQDIELEITFDEDATAGQPRR